MWTERQPSATVGFVEGCDAVNKSGRENYDMASEDLYIRAVHSLYTQHEKARLPSTSRLAEGIT